MTRPCKRRKVKNPSGKISRHATKNVVKRTVVYDKTVSRFWDNQKTIHQNFAAVGLVSRVNADLTSAKVGEKLGKWQAERVDKLIETGEKNMVEEAELGVEARFMQPMLDEQDVFGKLQQLFERDDCEEDHEEDEEGPLKDLVHRELEERSKQVPPKSAPKLSEYERQYIQDLTTKYGSDFKKMFLDHKLNSRQYTVRELEKMAARL